ncbi:MAG: SigE family RNA polymerase sigma factor [Nocardioides sp.]
MKASLENTYVDFVQAQQVRLGRIAYVLSGDRAAAEDLLQITLLKLYVAWPRVRQHGQEMAYARRIMTRAFIDEHRRVRWRRESVGLDDIEVAQSSAESAVLDRVTLVDAMQALPPMQRACVALRHWLGLSVAQTADELRISTGTVKSHTARGLEQLKRRLGPFHASGRAAVPSDGPATGSSHFSGLALDAAS